MVRNDLGEETAVWVEEGEPSALNRGLLYGDGVFESFRVYDGSVAFVSRHLDRLHAALDAVSIDEAFTTGRVADAVHRLTDEFDASDSYLRVTVTRGQRDGLLEPTETEPTVAWTAKPLTRRRYPPASVESTEVRRPVGAAGRHKTLNYLQNVIARDDVDSDEALMVDSDGEPVSGSVSNLFTVEDDAVVTPMGQIREGVTREVVIDLARDRDVEVREAAVDLEAADAVFLTNTTWGVRRVSEVDGRTLPQHPVVDELQESYIERALEDSGL